MPADRFRILFLAIGLGLIACGSLAAEPNAEPASEPQSPAEALRSMVVRPGFEVELVAAEPLTMDPVAFAWGPNGWLWVVEMADYPLGLDGKGQPGGRVRYLEDLDGDGRYDRSTLFLEGLGYPTGVMPWRGGVLVTCAPEIFYAEDVDGDGRADIRKTLFRGFGQGNQQHRVNGLRGGLDNWVYCANGDSGGSIESLKTGETVSVSGRDFRMRPDEGLIDPQAGPTQFIRECDDWGNWFGNNNSNPLFHFVLADHYMRRNSHFSPPDAKVQVSVAPGAAPVFPASKTVARFNDLNKANRFTSACSAMIYRDEFLGPEFIGNSFVCEPVHNLVHREVVEPSGVTFRSHRAVDEQQSEFLASRDQWFRPVMVRTGPDGAVWVADMYRQVIEHPQWIPADWQKRLDLRAGHDKGRIYRIFPAGKRPRPIANLQQLDAAELVAQLDSPNAYVRDLAQQMLVWRKDGAAVPLLKQAAIDLKRRPTCRLHALCALDGLAALDDATRQAALGDEHPGVRRHAVRLAESRLDDSPALAQAVLALVDDADAQVRLQVAYSVGAWHEARAGAALVHLAMASQQDKFTTAAVLSSINEENLGGVLDSLETTQAEPPLQVLPSLLALAVSMDGHRQLARLIEMFATPRLGRIADWQLSTAAGLLDVLGRRKLTLTDLRKQADEHLQKALDRLNDMFAFARAKAADLKADPHERIEALSLLGRGPSDRKEDLSSLAGLLTPQNPSELQAAAIAALGRLGDSETPATLLQARKGLGPDLRAAAIDVLLSRAAWQTTLLDAIEKGEVLPNEIDASRRQRLLDQRDANLRRRAEQLLAASGSADRRQVVDAYRSAATLPGHTDVGAAIFKKTCAPCHRLGEVGHAVGPDLTALTDKSADSLLVAILDPNRAVEAKFLTYTAVTTDGLTYTGMLAAETGGSISLLAAEGKQVQLLRTDLEALVGNSKSLMPEGVEKDVLPQQLADLLAFLRLQKPPRKQFAGNEPTLVKPEALRGEFYLLASQCEIYGSTLVGSSRVDLQACKLEYSIVSPK